MRRTKFRYPRRGLGVEFYTGLLAGVIVTTTIAIAIFSCVSPGPSKNDAWLLATVSDVANRCVDGEGDACESWLLYERDTDIKCALDGDVISCKVNR